MKRKLQNCSIAKQSLTLTSSSVGTRDGTRANVHELLAEFPAFSFESLIAQPSRISMESFMKLSVEGNAAESIT